MKQIVKRALARLAPVSSDPGLRVLLYHAVEEEDPSDRLLLRVSPETFRAQMEILRTEGYQVVPLKSLLDGLGNVSVPRVAITFDDGYRSQLQAASILEEFGFPATFFVVIRFLNGDQAATNYWEEWDHMGWKDIQALLGRGFEIGSHSVSHPCLTRCLHDQLQQEVKGAKTCLEDRLSQSVIGFSYPHGAYNSIVRHVVQEAGYQLGCTSVYGMNCFPWPFFELRRIEISGADRLVDFLNKLRGKYDWLGYWQRWCLRYA